MLRLRCVLFLILLLSPGLALAAAPQRIPAPAKMTAVTVYPDRALTSRSASLSLKPGSYLIAFDNLPALLQDDSVRVAGKGSAAATIQGLEIRRVFLEERGEERVQELDAQIRTLEQQAGVLNARKEGLTAQGAFLQSIRVAWGERISKELAIARPSTSELTEAAGFVGTGVGKVQEQLLEIETEKQMIRNRIDALRRQRDAALGSGRRESKSVEVLVEVARAGELTLELAAVVPRAGWVPAYDVRLAADAKSAELTFRALLRQQTGEDWQDVALTLSTARPAAGGAPPELVPWHIGFFRPPPPMEAELLYDAAAAAPAGLMRQKSARLAVEPVAPEEEPAAYETALLGDELSSVSFRIPRPLDLPADGSQHGSVVAIEQLPVSMEFLAVPKLSPYVFLRSELVNRAAYPLLPGKVSAFAGNTFTGNSQLAKVAAGETFELFFGTDEQVTVKREELKQHKEAGIFGRNRVSYRYRIELHNFRKEPVTVTLRDQLPLAGDAEIRVALDEPSRKPEEVASDGRLTWKIPLQPGEKEELTFGIVVEYPKDREIVGLQ